MSREIITVCLAPTDPADVTEALTAAMAPFWNDAEIPPGGVWQGEWQWWHVYGGYRTDGFAVRAGYEADPRLVRNPFLLDGRPRPPQPAGRCDGGPRGLLDLDVDRAPVAEQAGADWDRWAAFSVGFEPSLSLSAMNEQAPDGATAWAAYREQPVVRAAALLAGDERTRRWAGMSDPVGHYAHTREQFVHRETAYAVTPSVLLTLDGEWIDGTGSSSDPEVLAGARYYDFAYRYLDGLAEDALMIRVRFHT
ncbi:hypothetical protein ACFVXH_08375 [Kitasatospora sp. NPDC058184]|uniref:hypothetical protein n=1 Tax=unclassified Kitasatospora TaxID=2633591 RepID=UPI0036CAD8CA